MAKPSERLKTLRESNTTVARPSERLHALTGEMNASSRINVQNNNRRDFVDTVRNFVTSNVYASETQREEVPYTYKDYLSTKEWLDANADAYKESKYAYGNPDAYKIGNMQNKQKPTVDRSLYEALQAKATSYERTDDFTVQKYADRLAKGKELKLDTNPNLQIGEGKYGDIGKYVHSEDYRKSLVEPLAGLGEGRKYNYTNLDKMNANETLIFDTFVNEGDYEGAKAYLDEIQTNLDRRRTEELEGKIEANRGTFWGDLGLTLVSAPLRALGNITGGIETIRNIIHGEDPNPYSDANLLSNIANKSRETVSEDISNLGNGGFGAKTLSFLYDTGNSMIDSFIGASTLGGAYAPLMGLGAGVDHIRELYEQGATKEQALLGGALSGIAEATFEYLSLEHLVKDINPASVKEAIKYAMRQAGIEGSEEVFTEIANMITDDAVMGTLSERQRTISGLYNSGLSTQQIQNEMAKRFGEKVGLAFLGGAISGGVLGGVRGASVYNEFGNKGRELRESGKTDDVVYNAEMLTNLAPDTFEQAKNHLEGVQNNTPTDAELGALYYETRGADSVREEETEYRDRAKEILAQNKDMSRTDAMYSAVEENFDLPEEVKVKARENYDGKMSPVAYLNNYKLAYTYGKNGINTDYVSIAKRNIALTENAFKSAYEAGAVSRSTEIKKIEAIQRAAVEARLASGEPIEAGKVTMDSFSYEGTEYDGVDLAKMSKSKAQRVGGWMTFSKALAEATGVNISLYEGKLDAQGKRLSNKNGFYSPSTNTIYIDVNASDKSGTKSAFISTVSHELTHWMENKASGVYEQMRTHILDVLSKERGVSVQTLIAGQLGVMDENSSEEDAVSEIVAQSCENMLKNSEVAKKYLNGLDENTRSQFVATLKQFIANVKAFFDKILSDSKNEWTHYESVIFGELSEAGAELQKLWDEGFEFSVQYNQTEEFREAGIGVDTETGTAVNSTTTTIYEVYDKLGYKSFDEAIDDLSDRLSKSVGVSKAKAKSWLQAETSLASIILNDPENQKWLDYEADDRYDAIKTDTDYPQGTADFSNLCRKREMFTKMFANLQAQNPDTLFTANDIAVIRDVLTQKGIEAACALCYVEDRRQRTGEIANTFIDMYKKALKSQDKKIIKKSSSGKTTELYATAYIAKRFGVEEKSPLLATDDYIPNQYDFVTYEGFRKLTEEHPAIAMAFEMYNRSRGQGSARLIEGHAEYKREILSYTDDDVKRINNLGGLRIFSFSDFEAIHLIDLVQIISDCAVKGIKVQAYTKVPAFAKLVRNTGIKLNRSLIPANEGSKNAYALKDGKYVKVSPDQITERGIATIDGNEYLAVDTIEGINVADKNFLDERNSRNIGNVIIGISEKQIKMAMNDPMVDYIIPFHSNQSKKVLTVKNINEWSNYKKVQEDKATDAHTSEDAKKINIYNDIIYKYNVKTATEFVQRFVEACKENHLTPRFSEFLYDENGNINAGYYKMLVDFKTFDANGNILPQETVRPDFNVSDDNDPNGLKFMNEILMADKERSINLQFSDDVMKEVKERLAKTGKNITYKTKNSTNDDAYDSEGHALTQKQAEFFKDSKVRDENGNLLVVYHGTEGDFHEFNMTKAGKNGRALGYGFYLTPDIEKAQAYGSRIIKAYANAGKLLSFDSKTISKSEFKKFCVDMVNYELEEYASEGLTWQDSFISNYVYTYDNGMTKSRAISEFVDSVYASNETDVDLVFEIANANGMNDNPNAARRFYDVLTKSLGYDGLWQGNEIVVFNSNQIKNTDNLNPTSSPDIRWSSTDDVAYHAGDLGKAEPLSSQGYSRGTGHFGTGTYFVSNTNALIGSYGQRPIETVNLAKYNLFRPKNDNDGLTLHRFLKGVDGFIRTLNPKYQTYDEANDYLDNVIERGYEFDDMSESEQSDFISEIINIGGYNAFARIYNRALGWAKDIDKYNYWSDRDRIYKGDDYETPLDPVALVRELMDGDDGYSYTSDFIESYIKDVRRDYLNDIENLEEWNELKTKVRSILGITPEQMENALKESETAIGVDYETSKTSDSAATRFMKALGYEGINVQGLPRLDNTEYGTVIYDLKGEDLERKKEIGTARFSSTTDPYFSDTTELPEAYEILGKSEQIEAENESIATDLKNWRAIVEKEKTLTVPNDSALREMANEILTRTKMTGNIDSLVADLKEAYGYLLSPTNINSPAFFDKAGEIFSKLKMNDSYEEYKAFYNNLLDDMKRTLKVTDEQKERLTARYGGDKTLALQAWRGKLKISDNENIAGQSLTDYWNEMRKKYPELFKDVAEEDMAVELLKLADDTRFALDTLTEYYEIEGRRNFAVELYNQLWQTSELKTLADKGTKTLSDFRMQHFKAMSNLRDAYKAKLDEMRGKSTKYQQKISELRQQRDERERAAIQRGATRLQNYRINTERKALIKRIQKNAKTLNEWLVTNSAKEHIVKPLQNPVAKLLSALDFSSERLLNGGEATQRDISLDEAFHQVHQMVADIESGKEKSAGEADFLANDLAGIDLPFGFEKEMRELMNRVNQLYHEYGDNSYVLNNMNLEDLESLNKMIVELKAIVRNANHYYTASNGARIADNAESTIDSLGLLEKRNNEGRTVRDFFSWDNALPINAFDRFGEGGKAIFRALQDGQDELAFKSKLIKEFLAEAYTAKELKEWRKNVRTFSIGGKDIKMTDAHLMSLYCLNKRGEAAQRHMFKELGGHGISIDTFTDFKGLRSESVENVEGTTMTEAELNHMLSTLSDRQKEVADNLQRYMSNTLSAWGNKVTNIRFGIDGFTDPNYFRIHSHTDFTSNGELDSTTTIWTLANMGFTKELNPNANNMIVIMDIFSEFANHAADMARYSSLVLPVLDAYKWYTYKRTDKDNNKTYSVRNSLNTAYGKAAKTYIWNLMTDINGQYNGGRGESTFKHFVAKYKQAAVGYNLRVALLQPTAYVRASLLIDPKYLAKGLASNWQRGVNMAKNHSGIALWKTFGYFDTNVGRNYTEQFLNEDTVMDKIREFGMKGAELGDRYTWGCLWNAVEAEIADKNKNMDKSSDEFVKAVSDRFRDVIYRTQVADSTLTRSQLMRHQSGMVQGLTAFASESTVSYNLFQSIAAKMSDEARRTNKATAFQKYGKDLARAGAVFTATSLLVSLVEGAVDAARDDDDKDEGIEKYLKEFFSQYFGDTATKYLSKTVTDLSEEITIIGKVPVAKLFYTAARSLITGEYYYGSTSMDTEIIDTTYKALNDWKKKFEGKEVTTYKMLYDNAKAVSQFTGIAINNLVREFKTLWNTIMDIFDRDSAKID